MKARLPIDGHVATVVFTSFGTSVFFSIRYSELALVQRARVEIAPLYHEPRPTDIYSRKFQGK